MRLLDKPLDREDKNFELDSIKGNISRICISDDPVEIISSLGFAVDRLSMLAYSRMKELKDTKEGDE